MIGTRPVKNSGCAPGFGRPGRRRKDSIEMCQKQSKIKEWLPPQDRVQCLSLVKIVPNCRPPKMSDIISELSDQAVHTILMRVCRNRHDCILYTVKKSSVSFFRRKVEANLLSWALHKDLFHVHSPFPFPPEDGDRSSLRNAVGFEPQTDNVYERTISFCSAIIVMQATYVLKTVLHFSKQISAR
jgi:hypothetical protein